MLMLPCLLSESDRAAILLHAHIKTREVCLKVCTWSMVVRSLCLTLITVSACQERQYCAHRCIVSLICGKSEETLSEMSSWK